MRKKIEYSTIRPVLTAYYGYVDNHPVGKDPKVCNSMVGVFNKNPPKQDNVMEVVIVSVTGRRRDIKILLCLSVLMERNLI